MQDWKEYVMEARGQEPPVPWSEIGRELEEVFPDLTYEQCKQKARDYYRQQPEYKNKSQVNGGQELKQRVTYKDNGEMIFEGIIELMAGQAITPEIVMKAHNLDSDKWNVASFTSNAWQSQVKGGKKIVLWQSKITVRPRTTKEITFADVDRYFANKDLTTPVPVAKTNYDPKGEVLEICIPDLHAGLLAWRH